MIIGLITNKRTGYTIHILNRIIINNKKRIMKNRNIAPYLLATGTLLMPFVVFAQSSNPLLDVTRKFGDVVKAVFPILIGLAAIYFVWGLLKYVGSSGDDAKKEEARGTMLYGIIIIAVILGIWGLADLVLSFVGVRGGGTINFPTLPNSTGY